MSTFYLKSTVATEPKPGSVQNVDAPDWGSYGTAWDMTLTTNSGSNTSRIYSTYIGPIDDDNHYCQPITWITPPLATGSFNGAWSAKIRVGANSLPTGALCYVKAALYVWDYLDSLQSLIGNYSSETPINTTSVTEYTFNFGNANISIGDQDRFYLETWILVNDDLSDPGFTFIPRAWFNSATYTSQVICPGTQVVYSTPGNIMMKSKIGVGLN